MFKLSDLFILLAVGVSFAVSGLLWFQGFQNEGLFTAIWVPSDPVRHQCFCPNGYWAGAHGAGIPFW